MGVINEMGVCFIVFFLYFIIVLEIFLFLVDNKDNKGFLYLKLIDRFYF